MISSSHDLNKNFKIITGLSDEKIELKEVISDSRYLVRCSGNYNNHPAMMVMQKSSLKLPPDFKALLDKIAQLNHPNILKAYAQWTTAQSLDNLSISTQSTGLILEYAEQGSLFDLLILKNASLTSSQLNKIILGILNGLIYLQENKCAAAIKLTTNNILLTSDYTPKILPNTHFLEQEASKFATANIGVYGIYDNVLRYECPESSTREYQKTRASNPGMIDASHIFSFGITLWEMVTRKIAYDEDKRGANQIREEVIKGIHPEIPDGCPYESILLQCWENDPKKRPTAKDLYDVFEKMNNPEMSNIQYAESSALFKKPSDKKTSSSESSSGVPKYPK